MIRVWLIALMLVCTASPAFPGDDEGTGREKAGGSGPGAKQEDPNTIQGREEAKKDIENGEARILTFGLPIHSRGQLDTETGLPRGNMGCVITEARGRYAEAYNEEVRKALKDGRLDGKTLKHKVTSREVIEKRFEKGKAFDLVLSGAEIEAPGGKYSVSLRPRKVGDAKEATPYLYVKDLETGKSRSLMFVGGEAAKLLFDHEGTTALVRDDRYSTYMTFDLPTALFMQGFPDR